MDQSPIRKAVMHFDGSCLKNPGGPGGLGFRVVDADTGEVLAARSKALPADPGLTNNTAEWLALIEGLRYLATEAPVILCIEVRGDSRMVVKQMAGRWRCKKKHLAALAAEAGEWAGRIGKGRLSYHWVPRDENQECDQLSKGGSGARRGPARKKSAPERQIVEAQSSCTCLSLDGGVVWVPADCPLHGIPRGRPGREDAT